jgi:hypothetical protein
LIRVNGRSNHALREQNKALPPDGTGAVEKHFDTALGSDGALNARSPGA